MKTRKTKKLAMGKSKRVDFHYVTSAEMDEFNKQLLDERSSYGRIISSKSIKESSDNIERVITLTIVNNGHGAILHN